MYRSSFLRAFNKRGETLDKDGEIMFHFLIDDLTFRVKNTACLAKPSDGLEPGIGAEGYAAPAARHSG